MRLHSNIWWEPAQYCDLKNVRISRKYCANPKTLDTREEIYKTLTKNQILSLCISAQEMGAVRMEMRAVFLVLWLEGEGNKCSAFQSYAPLASTLLQLTTG